MADLEALSALFGGATGNKSYGDLDQFEKAVAGSDIYSQLAPAITGAKFNTQTWSPFTAGAVSLGQAFLGSALNSIGQRHQAEQLASVANVLPSLYSDPSSVIVPEGVDPAAFGALKLSAIKENALRSAKLDETKMDIFGKIFAVNPQAAMAALPGTAEKLGIGGVGSGGLPGLAGIPKDLRDDLVKESALNEEKAKSLAYIKNGFEEAKGLVGMSSAAKEFLGIPTKEGNALEGLGQGLIYQIDKIVGRELNSDVRKQFAGLTPRSYDTPETIDLKSKKFIDLIESLSKSTPLTESLAPKSAPVSAAAAQASLPGAPNMAEFKRMAVSKGWTKEQAKQHWIEMGGAP